MDITNAQCTCIRHFSNKQEDKLKKTFFPPEKTFPEVLGPTCLKWEALDILEKKAETPRRGCFFNVFEGTTPRDSIGGFQFGMTGSKMCEHFSMFTVKHAIFVGGQVKHLLFYRVGPVH